MKSLPQSITLLTQTLTSVSSSLGLFALIQFSQPVLADDLLVRKNVVDLTPEEKQDFVNALQTIKTTIPEGSSISVYDQFVAVHMGAMSLMRQGEEHQHHSSHTAHSHGEGIDIAHGNAAFLPWHREYLRRFEQALQTVDPNVTVPYWDWTDAQAIDTIFQPNFLGTNGQGVTIDIPGMGTYTGGPVVSGNFSAASGWVLNQQLHVNQDTGAPLGTSLIRFVQVPPATQYPLEQAEIDQVLAQNEYDTFRQALEGFISVAPDGSVTSGGFTHNYIHGLVGGVVLDLTANPPTFQPLGTMSSIPSSPNDPVFWLHHANVDRLWAEWQDNGHQGSEFYPDQGQPYGHNLNDLMWPWDGGESMPVGTNLEELLALLPVVHPEDLVQPADVLDYKNLGYTYDTNVAAVPTPDSTFGLLGLGALGSFAWLKRRQFENQK